MGKIRDLRGKRFGRLIVKDHNGKDSYGRIRWLCECDCKNTVTVDSRHLIQGKTRSCGCLRQETGPYKSHGLSRSAEYKTWAGMHRRCYNPSEDNYARYGGRGIKVCDRWRGKTGFINFLTDMGKKPSDAYSIDRINSDGDYSPENCKWSTITEQARNTRTNRYISYLGKTKTLVEWSEIIGINYKTLHARLSRGLSITEAFRKGRST